MCRKGKNDTFAMVKVDRERVRVALKWLKKNNHLYYHINLSEANLMDIPESGEITSDHMRTINVDVTPENTPEDFVSTKPTKTTDVKNTSD